MFSGIAGAGAATAAGAMIADHALRHFNKEKALGLLKSEKEVRDHITECMQALQRASQEFEESVNYLIQRMSSSRFDYSDSLKSIEGTKALLRSLMNWNVGENNKKKIAKLCETLLDMVSKTGGIQRLLQFLSECTGGAQTVGTAFVIASIPLHLITLIITSIDVHNGSKTTLAANLREHAQLLERDRTEIREAVNNHYF